MAHFLDGPAISSFTDVGIKLVCFYRFRSSAKKPSASLSDIRTITMQGSSFSSFLQCVVGMGRSPVSVVVEAGIIVPSEYGQKFKQKAITRLEVAKMIARSLATIEEYKPYIELFKELHNYDLPFTDYKKISDAFGTGIIGGYTDDSLGLDTTTNQAEATVMLLEEWV